MKIFLTAVFIINAIISFGQKQLHIYGGKDHDVYLGCLNCDNYNTNSIWNAYSTYGSSYNSKSIGNSYGSYGSEYSSTSPFNSYASDPPVIVDKDGGFYGYFTVNEYKDKRADFKLALTIYKFYDLIREDVANGTKRFLNSMRSKIILGLISLLLIVSLAFNYTQQKENKKLKSEVSDLSSQVDNLEDEKSELEDRVSELEEARENLQSNIEEARDNVDELKNQIDDNYYDKRDMERKVRDLEDKVDEMEDNNDN